MSLLKKALEQLGDGKVDGWFDSLITELDALVAGAQDKELREGGAKALNVLKENKDQFVSLGKKSFIMFLTYAAAERNDDAAKEFYRNSASANDIINGILDDAFDIDRARREKEEIIADAIEIAKLIAKGAKFLIPFILMII